VVLLALAAWLLVGMGLAPLLAPVLPAGSAPARLLGAWRASLWDGTMVIAACALALPALPRLRPACVARWMEPTTAEALAATRIWIAAILLASVVWEDLASTAALPREMLRPGRLVLVSLVHQSTLLDPLLANAAALRVFELGTALLLAMALAGLFTRWTVPAAALAYLLFASILRSYAWSYHTGLVPLYALLLLSFTPCGDAWSLDRWRRARRGLPVPPARVPRLRYALGRYLVWMAVALPYTMAGLSKLRNGGVFWWRSEHMKQLLAATVLEPMHFGFETTFLLLRGPNWVFGVLGLAAVVGEATFALVLVSRLARRALPLMMAGMHGGILLLQNILFPDLIAIQAIFYDWTPLRERVAAWAARAVEAAAAGIRWRPGLVLAPAGAATVAYRPRSAGGGGGMRGMETPPGPAGAASPVPEAGFFPSAAVDAPSEVPDAAVRRQAYVAMGFLLVALLAWTTRTETFPLTAMQMFSRPVALEPVEYVRPLVRYEDGTREPARFEQWIGAVADARYRWLLRDWKGHPERIAILRDFLDACARRANAAAAPGRRVVRFELEVRRWDFRRDPTDPQRGRLLSVLTHDAPRDGTQPHSR
jgi:hypothetical protein